MLVEYRFPYWYCHCPVENCMFNIGTERTPNLADVVDLMLVHIQQKHADTRVYSLPTGEAVARGMGINIDAEVPA